MGVPSGGEATTYSQAVKRVEARVVLALSSPIWDAQVTDTFGGSSVDTDLWVTSIPEPDVSGGFCNLAVYGDAPWEFLYSRPKWFPMTEDLGFKVTIVAQFPDASNGYAVQFGLFGLEAGRGKTSDPLRVVKLGTSDRPGALASYPFVDSAQAAGDLMLSSSFYGAYQRETNGLGTPEGSHTYVFEWDPDGGQDGGGELLVIVDGLAYIEYDNENASAIIETALSRVANPNCVRPYGMMFQYVGDTIDRVESPSGGITDAENQLQIASVTVDELTPRARAYLTVGANPGNTETVTIDGKVYTFLTVLVNANGNVQIGGSAQASMQNLAAAIKLDTTGEGGTGAGTAYAAAMTKHTTVTAVQRNLGGDGSSEGLRVIALTGGTAANSIAVSETLTSGSWSAGTLANGATGEGFETRSWPAWTNLPAEGDIDDAFLGERFDADGETWALMPGVENWNVRKGRDQQADRFQVKLTGAADRPRRARDFAVTDLSAVGYWGLGAASGAEPDKTANGNNGTVTLGAGARNAAGLDTPGPDGCIEHDGADTYTTISDTAVLQNIWGGGGGVCFAFNADSDGEGNAGRIMSKRNWAVFVLGEVGGLVRLQFRHLFSGDNGTWVTDVNIPINTVIYVMITYDSDATGNDPTFHIWDGTSFTTRTVDDGLTRWVTPTGTRDSDASFDLLIGSGSFGVGTNVFDGHIDEVGMFAVSPTAAQGEAWTERMRGNLVAADALAASPSITQNVFQGDRFLGRPILIDTRVLREDTTATAWKRQICGIVEDVQTDVSDGLVTVTLSGRDRPSTKLDTEITRSYISAELMEAAPGSVSLGFALDEIFEDLIDLSDMMWDGDELGATDTSVADLSAYIPQAITAGPNLLAAFTQMADEMGLEVWRKYAVSGTGRYGQIIIGRWILGPEHGITADEYGAVTSFSLIGQGAAGTNNVERIRFREGTSGAVGHVSVHFDAGTFPAGTILWGGAEPGAGDYPHVPYPPRARELRVSLSESGFTPVTIGMSGIADQFGNVHHGGPGVARFRRENSTRRTLRVTIVDADWVEPTDPFDFADPDHTGIASSELWVANDISLRYQNGTLIAEVEMYSSAIVTAITRGL